MHKVGDFVVYKRDVCEVVGIKKSYFRGLDYFVLLPLNDKTLKIQVPTNNKFLRNVISKKKVIEIINNIPSIELIKTDNKLIENEYKRLLNSDKYEDLIKIIKTTYIRNKEREDSKKKISDKDKFYFEKAEKLLYSEFSIALNMTFDETKEYVTNKVISLV